MSKIESHEIIECAAGSRLATRRVLTLILPVVALVLVVYAVMISGLFGQAMERLAGTPEHVGYAAQNSPLPPGTVLPPISVEGWVNGTGPTNDELKGQVVVIDVWATWCGNCRAKIPELIAAHKKYNSPDVSFIGLAGDEEAELRHAVDELEIPWPNAYGTSEMLKALRIYSIPAVLVVGRDGRVVWNNNLRSGSLEDAIQGAINKP